MLNQVVKVKTRESTQVEPLQCIVWPSFLYEVQLNTECQISFVAQDDHSIAYSLITENNLIEFDGQEYIIQQLNHSFTGGYATVSVTALHVYTDCNRIMNYTLIEGVKTYGVQDVLNAYFQNNTLGFTTSVVGNFERKEIENLGGDSAFDGLSKIVSTWPDAVIEHDNRHITVYQHDNIAKSKGNRLSYGYNSDNIQLETDISSLVNSIFIFAGKDEKNKPYFESHFVKDESSIKKYGEWPGQIFNDDRYKYASAADVAAKKQLIPNPPLTVTVDYKGTTVPKLLEVLRFEILETGYVTDIEVVGYSWHPFDDSQVATVTLNSIRKTIIDYLNVQNNRQKQAQQNQSNVKEQINNTLNQGISWDWRGE